VEAITVGAEGPRILFVHGNDLSGPFYDPLARALTGHGLRTTLLTLPGFHGVPPLPAPSWSALVDALERAALEDDDDPPRVLAGHSMGGLLALLLAARKPAWLRGLVLLEPAIFPGRLAAAFAARRYLKTVVRRQRDDFENWNGGMRRLYDAERAPRAAIDLYLEVRSVSHRATSEALFSTLPALYPLPFERIEVPRLLVRGAGTGALGRAMAVYVGLHLGVRPVVVEEAAHWLVHEQDAAIAEAIARFARALPGYGGDRLG
jgi:pimeloyl-ACP methyl ester carboxylesterase